VRFKNFAHAEASLRSCLQFAVFILAVINTPSISPAPHLTKMSIADLVLTPYTIPIALALFWIIPYLTANTDIRNVPGPFFAKFSNFWLLSQARQGKRYKSVDEAHKKYGKLVRIQPDHVSVADESAINTIYGHGNGFLKS
jgi:benzoate 4-monooxygenase